MAGRGRGATLPAWMQQQQYQQPSAPEPAPAAPGYSYSNGASGKPYESHVPGQFEDARHDPSSYSSRHESERGRDYERDRDRDRDRDRGRYRSSRKRSRSNSRSSSRHKEDRRRDRHRRSRRSESRSRGRSSGTRSSRGDRSARPKSTRVPRRQRKPSNFDVYPPGVTDENAAAYAAQAILQHNMQALQGAVGPAAFGGPPPGVFGGDTVNAQQTRHARRIYVGGIENVTEADLSAFFNDVVDRGLNKKEEGGSVVSVYINRERHFAFVELKSIELATACMTLDGILFMGNPVKIRRPNDYNPSLVPKDLDPIPEFDLNKLGIVATTVSDGPGKIFVGGIPYNLEEEQIKELLQAFGTLRSFHLVRDPGSQISKGYGFCEYVDISVTDKACEGLNNLQLGDKTLTVRRATAFNDPAFPAPAGMDPQQAVMDSMATTGGVPARANTPASRVLVLKNMVTPEELNDSEEYDDIVDDIRGECSKFGSVLSILIPRPGGENERAVGKVFVEFEDVAASEKAANDLHGRGFASRVVEADFISEAAYAAKDL